MPLGLRSTLARIFRVHEPEAPLPKPQERRDGPRMPSHQTALVEWQDMEKGEQAVAVRVENQSRNGYAIRAPRLIAIGKTVLITPEDEAPIKAVVRHCASGVGGWRLGVELVPKDRRRFDREPMYCAAELSCTRAGRGDDWPVIIRDASEGGLQIESPEPLTLEQVIEVTHLGASRQGVVMHCRAAEDGYRIGVQFIGPAHPEGSRQIN